MKKVLLIIALTVTTLSVYSQENPDQQDVSNAELFALKSGSLLKTEYFFIDKIRNTIFESVKYTDMLSNEVRNALRFEYAVLIGMQTETRSSYLDEDEVDALIQSLEIIRDNVLNSNPLTETEVTFTSRSGFQAGCLWNSGSWTPFIKGKYYDSDSLVLLRNEKTLNDLIQAVKKVKAKF